MLEPMERVPRRERPESAIDHLYDGAADPVPTDDEALAEPAPTDPQTTRCGQPMRTSTEGE